MKNLFTNFNLRKLLTPLVFTFFFFTYFINANAAGVAPTFSINSLTAPATTSGCYNFSPGTITGTLVTVTNFWGGASPPPAGQVNFCSGIT